MPGHHWYHPHHHGGTALQNSGGMYGSIEVNDPEFVQPPEIEALRSMVGVGGMIWTPGVNLEAAEGVLGQRYGHPGDAVRAGSDGVIVGSGIHGSGSAGEAARAYADASWAALLER